MKTYIEIVEKKTQKPVHRIDVSGRSESAIAKVENGVNINLNHSDFYTRSIDSETELKTGDLNQ